MEYVSKSFNLNVALICLNCEVKCYLNWESLIQIELQDSIVYIESFHQLSILILKLFKYPMY